MTIELKFSKKRYHDQGLAGMYRLFCSDAKTKIKYEKVFLWKPQRVSGKLKWLTIAMKKKRVVAWLENDHLPQVNEYTLGYVTKKEAFIDSL